MATKTKTKKKNKTSALDIFTNTLAVLSVLALFVIGYGIYFFVTYSSETVTSVQIDSLTYAEDETFPLEVNYYSNESNNGEEVFEFKINYYMNPEQPTDLEEIKDIYTTGIQWIDGVSFAQQGSNIGWGTTNYLVPAGEYYYYNMSGDTGFSATNEFSSNDRWLMDFSGHLGLLGQKGDIEQSKSFLWWGSYFRYDINSLMQLVYDSIQGLSPGDYVLTLDMSEFFDIKAYNEETKQFDLATDSDSNYVYINARIHISASGMADSSQSLFNIVKNNDAWVYNGIVANDFYNAESVFTLTVNDFDYVEQDGMTWAILKEDAVEYLQSFPSTKIKINLNLTNSYITSNGYTVEAVSTLSWADLNVDSVTISAPAGTTQLYCDSLVTVNSNVTLVEV